MDETIRPVAWLGDSRKQIRSFPPEVRKSIGVALYDAQKGDKAPTAKPFRGVGSGRGGREGRPGTGGMRVWWGFCWYASSSLS